MQTYVKKEPKKRENWEKTGAQKRGKIKENKTSAGFRGKIGHSLKNARKNSKMLDISGIDAKVHSFNPVLRFHNWAVGSGGRCHLLAVFVFRAFERLL